MTCRRVHARLDDLERDLPLDRLGLLGHPDGAHAAFADLLQQLVRPDLHARTLGSRPVERRAFRWRDFVERAQLLVRLHEPIDAGL